MTLGEVIPAWNPAAGTFASGSNSPSVITSQPAEIQNEINSFFGGSIDSSKKESIGTLDFGTPSNIVAKVAEPVKSVFDYVSDAIAGKETASPSILYNPINTVSTTTTTNVSETINLGISENFVSKLVDQFGNFFSGSVGVIERNLKATIPSGGNVTTPTIIQTGPINPAQSNQQTASNEIANVSGISSLIQSQPIGKIFVVGVIVTIIGFLISKYFK